MKRLKHSDEKGRARMTDVSTRPETRRHARATGFIRLQAATARLIRQDAIQKGNVLRVAELAGIQAAKQTWQTIPLCHQLRLSGIEVRTSLGARGIRVTSEISCLERTGVEMEALVAVSTALLAIYDMCKAVDKQMAVESVRLVSKVKDEPTLPVPGARPKSARAHAGRPR